jgi:hypothetical protein
VNLLKTDTFAWFTFLFDLKINLDGGEAPNAEFGKSTLEDQILAAAAIAMRRTCTNKSRS